MVLISISVSLGDCKGKNTLMKNNQQNQTYSLL